MKNRGNIMKNWLFKVVPPSLSGPKRGRVKDFIQYLNKYCVRYVSKNFLEIYSILLVRKENLFYPL